MGILGKVFSLFLNLIFPEKISGIIMNRLERSKKVLTSNLELRIFWRVLFFPIVLPVSLLVGLAKMIVIWVLPNRVYHDFRYILYQFYKDITARKMGLKLAWKRACLCYELFTKGKEEYASFGEKNPDITFYVIRPYYYVAPNELLTHPQHLLYYYYLVLQKISYAVKNHWMPVVDWEHYDGLLYFAEEEPIHGTKNAWEYFWEQPSPYSLDEVYQSKNVILSTRNSIDYGLIPPTVMKRPFNKYAEGLAMRCARYAQLTPFNEYTEKYIQDYQTSLFPENKRILGVVYRSTSYGQEETPNKSHPVQPSLSALIVKVKKLMQQHQMEYVFFVNEESKNVEHMREVFGDKLIVLPRPRYENFHTFTPEDPNPLYVLGQRYPTNLGYLTEIALLSRCTGLVGAMSSGTRSAIIWNQGKYEVLEIIDLGLW